MKRCQAAVVFMLLSVLAVGGPWIALSPAMAPPGETPTVRCFKFQTHSMIMGPMASRDYYIDVIGIHRACDGTSWAKLILEKVYVLESRTISEYGLSPFDMIEHLKRAVFRNTRWDGKYHIDQLTVRVTASQAEALAHYQRWGRLIWHLRKPDDAVCDEATTRIRLKELLERTKGIEDQQEPLPGDNGNDGHAAPASARGAAPRGLCPVSLLKAPLRTLATPEPLQRTRRGACEPVFCRTARQLAQ
jgi:hypothetical protein